MWDRVGRSVERDIQRAVWFAAGACALVGAVVGVGVDWLIHRRAAR